MLKPMKPKTTIPRNVYLWALVGLLVLSGIIAIATAFSGGGDGADEVNAVYTNAAATLAVQQLTLQASTPSVTPTTFTQTPTATFTALASPTLFTSQILATNTPGTGTGGGSGAVGCNNSVYVADVTIPDDTAVNPGQTFTKTWKLQNTGTCPWTTAYKVSFVSGNAMGGAATPLTVTVAPGASGDVSVAMTAPATAGDAIGYWILTSDGGQNFGTSFYVKIKVGGTTTGGTTTATATGVVVAPAPVDNPTFTSFSCAQDASDPVKYKHTGTLTWADLSNNESGFNIYLNGTLLTTITANITSYAVDSAYLDAGSVTYGVEAVNSAGAAPVKIVTMNCP